MSRTIRRKNAQPDVWVTHDYEPTECGAWQRIKKEGKEYKKAVNKFHRDNGRNEYTPSRAYRQHRENELTTINKKELIRYKKNNDYEVMAKANPNTHYYDWS